MYNDLVSEQDDTVYFQIVEESATKELPNGCALRKWENFNKKFQPMTGVSKTIIQKKFAKCDLDDVTWDPEDWITELELLRGNLKNWELLLMMWK